MHDNRHMPAATALIAVLRAVAHGLLSLFRLPFRLGVGALGAACLFALVVLLMGGAGSFLGLVFLLTGVALASCLLAKGYDAALNHTQRPRR